MPRQRADATVEAAIDTWLDEDPPPDLGALIDSGFALFNEGVGALTRR